MIAAFPIITPTTMRQLASVASKCVPVLAMTTPCLSAPWKHFKT
jgi:hypothetical protein